MRVEFEQGREVAAEQVPDSGDEFAAHRGRGDVAAASFHGNLPTPAVQGGGFLVHGVLSRLDDQGAHVAAAGFANAFLFALGVVPDWSLRGDSPM